MAASREYVRERSMIAAAETISDPAEYRLRLEVVV
jgi:hypothetical protein